MRWLTVLLVMGWGLLIWAILVHQPPQIAIENQSGVTVTSVRLISGGQTADFGVLEAGSLDRHVMPLGQEGPTTIVLQFADGRELEASAGWSSAGRIDIPRIVIHSPDSVSIVD